MRLKSYYSETVEAAIELARQDLGDEALLVNARPATPDQLHLGEYEVVFGVAGEDSASALARDRQVLTEGQDAQPSRTGSPAPSVKRWMPPEQEAEPNADGSSPEAAAPASDFLAAAPPDPGRDRPDPPSATITHEPDAGLGEQIAALRRVTAALAARIPAGEDLEGTSQSLLPATPLSPMVDPTLGVSGASRKIVALVGPAGVGKTTTLIKLAVSHGLAENRTVQLVTTDLHRVGAASRLRSMTLVLGLACRPAASTEVLEQLLKDGNALDLLLLDTPPNLSAIPGLAQFIAQHPEIDTHLVLAASMSSGAITAAASLYRESKPDKLILTKLDELSQKGSFTEEVRRARSCSGLPISFFAASPEIPDGLEEASEVRLTASEDAKPTEMRATA